MPYQHYSLDDIHETLAIFAIYQPKSLSLLIKRTIQHLFKLKIKIILVIPHAINPNDIAFLKENQCIVLTRSNFGRDFGGYKYGMLYLLDNPELLKPFKKILFLNDSIFFPIKENDVTLANILTYPHDVIGLAENYKYHWHIGSYFILFKKDFLLHKGLQDFWKKYKPYSSRFHAIKKGEVALGKKIKQLTDSCEIVYSGKKLLGAVEKSFAVKKSNVYHFTQLVSNQFLTKQKALSDNLFFLKKYINLSVIGKYIEINSPVHIFPLALIEYLDCFFIKRDLCYRGLYSISQITHYIASINNEESVIAALNLDLRTKSLFSSMPIFKKILCASGAI